VDARSAVREREASERSKLQPVSVQPHTRLIFREGALDEIGAVAHDLGFARTLVVADRGIVDAGYVARVAALLDAAGIQPSFFHEFAPNPDSDMVEAGRVVAMGCGVDSIVAIGGGSSLDCAKGINFVLTNGGTMADYRGYGKAPRPLLPMIGVPTTAGTGSEAQSYALISDPVTHAKMACGDSKAAFRVAILDPLLTVSLPASVSAVAGYDALSHAVESHVSTARSAVSTVFSRDAWRLLDGHYERVLADPRDLAARGAMLLGAYEAGAAIEASMLGATHACANALTAHQGTTHGVAIAVLLPHVVRWNGVAADAGYAELLELSGEGGRKDGAEGLAVRLDGLARAAGLPATLRDLGVPHELLPTLAAFAATQWTGTFNPRPFDEAAARELFERAF
jgi:alcohol dehydrogenase